MENIRDHSNKSRKKKRKHPVLFVLFKIDRKHTTCLTSILEFIENNFRKEIWSHFWGEKRKWSCHDTRNLLEGKMQCSVKNHCGGAFSATQVKGMVLKIIILTFIWLLLTCNSFGKANIKLKMMPEQKLQVHNALRSIKGINTFWKTNEAIMFMKNMLILHKLQNILTLITPNISGTKKECCA